MTMLEPTEPDDDTDRDVLGFGQADRYVLGFGQAAELLRSHVICQPFPGADRVLDHGHTGCYAAEVAARTLEALVERLTEVIARSSKGRILGTHGSAELAAEIVQALGVRS